MTQTQKFINDCEQNYKDIVAHAVDEILRDGVPLVAMGGPSSSGKTITCMALTAGLNAAGHTAKIISTDDFFRNASESPDFDSVDALDSVLLSRTLADMLAGQTVLLPKFDFITGTRSPHTEPYLKSSSEIVIIEGLHALNPLITQMLPEERYLDIFISVDTEAVMPSGEVLSRQDVRFLRRLIRDYKFRGASPELTFKLWENVLLGEQQNILPYESRADLKINSYLAYETSVVKHQAMVLLEQVEVISRYYPKAQELLRKLRSQTDISEEWVPADSMLREFLGGSSFFGK